MTKSEFQELQTRAAASGMTLKSFLQAEGVAYSTYNYWYRKMKAESETTERYMGSFDTSKTDNTLRTLFKKKPTPKPQAEDLPNGLSKEEQAIELLKGMTPAQIMAVISAINK